jgi:thymidylate kinase
MNSKLILFYFVLNLNKKRGDLEKDVVEILSSFVFELIVDEELAMARLLRKKLLNKLERKTIEENSKHLKIFEDLLDSSKIKQAQKILPYLNTFTK